VASAAQLDAVDGSHSTQRIGIEVVELDESTLAAPMAAAPYEGAPPQVAYPDGTLHRC
jgi:hypothetical protein